jgi:hypothetical protein
MGRPGNVKSYATRRPGISEKGPATDNYDAGGDEVQCPGEHIGGGEPPSANDAVVIVPVNKRAARTRRTSVFMTCLLLLNSYPHGYSATPYGHCERNLADVRKTSDWRPGWESIKLVNQQPRAGECRLRRRTEVGKPTSRTVSRAGPRSAGSSFLRRRMRTAALGHSSDRRQTFQFVLLVTTNGYAASKFRADPAGSRAGVRYTPVVIDSGGAGTRHVETRTGESFV